MVFPSLYNQHSFLLTGAGADGGFIPNLKDKIEIEQIASTIHLPLNVVYLLDCDGLSILKNAGVKGISVGNAMFDAIIFRRESLCHKITVEQSTKRLFEDVPIKTLFKD